MVLSPNLRLLTRINRRGDPACQPPPRKLRSARLNGQKPNCGAPEGCPRADICPLNKVRAGTCVRIKRLSAAPELSQRLREMGFCEEQKIKIVSRHANLICQVCNARLGISEKLAAIILVEPLPPGLTVV